MVVAVKKLPRIMVTVWAYLLSLLYSKFVCNAIKNVSKSYKTEYT